MCDGVESFDEPNSSEEHFTQAIQEAVDRRLAFYKPTWEWRDGRLVLSQPEEATEESEARAKLHLEVIVPGRKKFLEKVDELIPVRPSLAKIFDPRTREELRKRVLGADQHQVVTYSATYGLISDIISHRAPLEMLDNVELALSLSLNSQSPKEHARLIERVRGTDSLAAEDELLVMAGFVQEFGPDAIEMPNTNPAARRPEFHITIGSVRVAIECKALFDQQAIRTLNEHMLRTGQPWASFGFDNQVDIDRFRAALVKKIKQNQGSGPTIFVMSLYTAWVQPEWAADVIKNVLCQPAAFKLATDELPLAIALIGQRMTQGIWLNDPALRAVGVSPKDAERVRTAIKKGYQLRSDKRILTESDWK